jgi:hypothetical protein
LPQFGSWAQRRVKKEGIIHLVKGKKKRNPLNVVPVEVRQEDMSLDRSFSEFPENTLAQRPQSGAAVENDEGVVV